MEKCFIERNTALTMVTLYSCGIACQAPKAIESAVFSMKMRLRNKVVSAKAQPDHGGRYGQCNTNSDAYLLKEETGKDGGNRRGGRARSGDGVSTVERDSAVQG